MGYEKLLERESAEICFEVDVELSPDIMGAVEKLIAEKRQGMHAVRKSKKRITERFLRYTATIQILPQTGHLRILDESLRALKKNGALKRRNPFIERVSAPGRQKLHLRVEGQAHPIFYDIGLDHSLLSMPLYEPHYPHITAFREQLATWRFYCFEPRTLMRDNAPLARPQAIGPRGENLAAFLNLLKADDGRQMEAFNLSLKLLHPPIEQVDIERSVEGLLSLRMVENGRSYSGRIISEGTLRILGLLAALHPESPATVMGYEEPENGLHPARLKLVADLFNHAQKHPAKQILVSTHCPIFPTSFEDHFFLLRKMFDKKCR